jgi:hypothetical protein
VEVAAVDPSANEMSVGDDIDEVPYSRLADRENTPHPDGDQECDGRRDDLDECCE